MNERLLTIIVNKPIFPATGGIVEFNDEKVINLLKEASYRDENIVLVPKEKPSPVTTEDVGVLVEVEQFLSSPFGADAKLAYKAINNVKILEVKIQEIVFDTELAAECTVESLKYGEGDSLVVKGLFHQAKELYEDYIKLTGAARMPFTENDINACLDGVMMTVNSADKLKFIRSDSTEERLILFIKALNMAISIYEVDESVSQKVREAIDLNQKEYYIREQIRALSSEIEDEDETEEYTEKIDALKASDEIKAKLKKEAIKLRRMAPASPELALLKNYLDTVLELPWGIYTEDNEDLRDAERILNEDHYGLEKVKERLIETLAVRKLSKEGRSPIICLVGPPGIGKTSVALSIAKAMNRKYVRLSFGGVRDEAEIRGHRKTYIGAMPGRIITGVKTAGSMNPVFLMDEIDKMASDYKGDPASALLEVLDPEQNVNFRDHFVEMPFDLSKVLFITTANTLDTISRPLLDRMEIIEMSGYTEQEKFEIAKKYLVKKAEKQCGVENGWVTLCDDAIYDIINRYTRESGVRGLEKSINAVMRKVARKFVEKEQKDTLVVTKKNLDDYLGVPKYLDKAKANKDRIGVVTGLAWTAVGGETLNIEVMITSGKGETIITGNLGSVMQESAKIAISYCRNISDELNLPQNFFKENDIHIHVPEGATPKDGPSAGITIATALASALSNRKVDGNVAMTGELTLRGDVLPIGGLKEKTLAAVRAGVKKVFVPEDNKKDYKELPETVKKKIKFVFVNNVKNVIKGSLL